MICDALTVKDKWVTFNNNKKPANIYLFKVNRETLEKCETYVQN